MKEKIRLDSDEWSTLSDMVWGMRGNDPTASVIQLANRAIAQFPRDRQRTVITNKDVQPIAEQLAAKHAAARDNSAEMERMQQRLEDAKRELEERSTAEELMTSISDEEMLRMYKHRVLDHVTIEDLLSKFDPHALGIKLVEHIPISVLVGIAAQKVTAELLHEQPVQPKATPVHVTYSNGHSNGNGRIPPKPSKNKRPKVVIAGILQKQADVLRKRFQHLDFVTYEKLGHQMQFPNNADLYISMTKFIHHSTDRSLKVAGGDRFLRCAGGMTDINRIITSQIPVGPTN